MEHLTSPGAEALMHALLERELPYSLSHGPMGIDEQTIAVGAHLFQAAWQQRRRSAL